MKRAVEKTFESSDLIEICTKWLTDAQTYKTQAQAHFAAIERLLELSIPDSEKEICIDIIGLNIQKEYLDTTFRVSRHYLSP